MSVGGIVPDSSHRVGWMRRFVTFARPCAALLGLMLAGCGQGQQAAQAPAAPPTVTVATPIKRSIVDYDEYVGRFVPIDAVEVRARVSGYLEKVHFTDGQ